MHKVFLVAVMLLGGGISPVTAATTYDLGASPLRSPHRIVGISPLTGHVVVDKVDLPLNCLGVRLDVPADMAVIWQDDPTQTCGSAELNLPEGVTRTFWTRQGRNFWAVDVRWWHVETKGFSRVSLEVAIRSASPPKRAKYWQ